MATIHASAVLVGSHAIVIRGPSGAGKSRLALDLIEAQKRGALVFSRLVADDRVILEAHHGRLIARAPPALAGLLEIRGIGVRQLPYEALGAVGWVVDLAEREGERMPERAEIVIEGIELPRLAVAAGEDPFRLVVAALTWGSRQA